MVLSRQMPTRVVYLCLLLCFCVGAKPKKRKVNWEQGVVCTKSGLCLEEPEIDYESGSVTAIFNNDTKQDLHNCMFVFPVYAWEVLTTNAQHYSFNPILAGQKILLRAKIIEGGNWTNVYQTNVTCTEGSETVYFRFPLFGDWFLKHAWQKQHENDSEHGRDPNQR